MKDSSHFFHSSSSRLVIVCLVSLVLVSAAVIAIDSRRSYWVFLDDSSSSSSWKWGGGDVVPVNLKKVPLELHPRLESFGQEALSDSSPLYNRSSSSLLANNTNFLVKQADDKQVIQLNDTLKTKMRRVSSRVIRVEASLARARALIREAAKNESGLPSAQQDPDYVPYGPVYRNANAFHRSYLEMEKVFKIFVYKEGEPPLFHDGPCRSIYSSEGRFIYDLETNTQFRTSDPDIAQVHFLPFSITKMVHYLYEPNSFNLKPVKQTVVDYINVISNKYPYWNRSLGADHFFLSCHDWGPEVSYAIPYLYNNSIRVLCNANSSEGFNPSKDATLPEINLRTGDIKGLIGGPSPSKRPYLGFFAGGVHGPIRPLLLKHWKGVDQDLRIYEYLPKELSYYDMMRKSKFCICPSGYEVASPRIVEAMYSECVPVIISDHYVLPFSDVLNWKSFSVQIQVGDIPRLKSILMSISQRQYIRMHRRVKQVQRHFVVNSTPKRYDVFHMIIHSVWLRRLNRIPHYNDQNN
eukprot:TRINITY_DN2317_c0_g1_i1.p1 TRINITY_DN2317_c0_g1~~TRINITY_DN2317_c0_g1_i1.p1  ORF type:complete len:522 (+),score=66.24 TRINITY_DN2317_c0_g1_i1:454-2019(+)